MNCKNYSSTSVLTARPEYVPVLFTMNIRKHTTNHVLATDAISWPMECTKADQILSASTGSHSRLTISHFWSIVLLGHCLHRPGTDQLREYRSAASLLWHKIGSIGKIEKFGHSAEINSKAASRQT